MKVIIPMSGLGSRFLKAGYKSPKPLIEVDGKPIIEHVIGMFKDEKDFIFICNHEHLKNTNMRNVLEKLCPTGKIFEVERHKKGPVYAVSKVFDLIDDNEPVFVNYCDFCCYWDYDHLKKLLNKNIYDGLIPAYKDFHPHSLRDNNYAFMKVKDYLLQEIKEKEPFTKNKINEFASSGTYFFNKGYFIKKYFSEIMEKQIAVNDEYYCSLIYNLMIKDNLKVGVYELEHFMQWGTPNDLEEYKQFSEIFKKLVSFEHSKEKYNLTTIITMAGKGSRFKSEGYEKPKPLIEVSQAPMIFRALSTLPKSERYRFVCQENLFRMSNFKEEISSNYPNSLFIGLDQYNQGQAISALKGIEDIQDDEPITISACDHAMFYNSDDFKKLFLDSKVDIIIWTCKWHPPAVYAPNMYGWVKVDKYNTITDVSIKKSFEDSLNHPLIIGTFTFKRKQYLEESIKSMIERKGLVNNEYYIDGCIKDAIKLGLKVKAFDISDFLCWGTPDELKSFEYWQSCFHKWENHPYSWEKDAWNNKKSKNLPKLSKTFIPGIT